MLNFTTRFFFILFLLIHFSCGKDEELGDPKSFTIVSVKIEAFPYYNSNGNTWDSFFQLEPDIFLTFSSGTVTSTADRVTDTNSNVSSGSKPTFIPLNEITLDTISSTFTIGLYDDDDGSLDDFMGKVSFNPNDYVADVPTTFVVSNSSISLNVALQWNY